MDLQWNEEQRLMIQSVRDFMQKEVAPHARELDEKAEPPREILQRLAELGLFGMPLPEEHGGLNLDTPTYCAIIEEISKVCAALAITISVHNSVGAYPVLVFGTDEQKKKFLPRLAHGEIGAFSLTEPDSGSDAAAVACQARRDGDSYIMNGSKLFVTNAAIAELYLVMARTNPDPASRHRGISAFLIERGSPGLRVGKAEAKMGIRASDTAELVFEDCRVPAANRLGDEGMGFRIAMMSLDNGRIGVGAQAVGIAQAALEAALRYAKERQQFGQPLADFQAIQWKLAQMATEIDAARLLVMRAAWLKDRGVPYSKEAAMAKLYSSEMCTRATHAAVQIHGGYGYMKEWPVERYYRDARITEIYEGTSEMQRLVIARSVLGR